MLPCWLVSMCGTQPPPIVVVDHIRVYQADKVDYLLWGEVTNRTNVVCSNRSIGRNLVMEKLCNRDLFMFDQTDFIGVAIAEIFKLEHYHTNKNHTEDNHNNNIERYPNSTSN